MSPESSQSFRVTFIALRLAFRLEIDGIRMARLTDPVGALRKEVFSRNLPLDEGIREISTSLPSHRFLANPASQYPYIYLTRFVKVLAEEHFGGPFHDLSILDWGCGKG